MQYQLLQYIAILHITTNQTLQRVHVILTSSPSSVDKLEIGVMKTLFLCCKRRVRVASAAFLIAESIQISASRSQKSQFDFMSIQCRGFHNTTVICHRSFACSE